MNSRGLKDVLLRVPHWMMDTRPKLTDAGNKSRRQPPGQKPEPPEGEERL
jgi:hypothetical protein